MAMTIDSLERILKKAFDGKLQFQVHRDAEIIEISWSGWSNYRNATDQDALRVMLSLQQQGQYLEIIAPQVYDASTCSHLGALCRALLGVSLRTNVVQFSYDESDGEVRASAEIVLMDGTCTAKQLRATIEILTGVINEHHHHILRAMSDGIISFPDEGTLIRPSLEGETISASTASKLDANTTIRDMLIRTRTEGRKMWENAAPTSDVGRHG